MKKRTLFYLFKNNMMRKVIIACVFFVLIMAAPYLFKANHITAGSSVIIPIENYIESGFHKIGYSFDKTNPPFNPSPNTSKTLSSITYNQASTSLVFKSTSNNVILRLDFLVSGCIGSLNLNSIVVKSLNTSDADITNVKLYRTSTTSFSTTNQLGSTKTFSAGIATFSSLAFDLPGDATTYVWITYDVHSGATINNTIDAKIEVNKINVNGTTYPVSEQSPIGSRIITSSKLPGGVSSNLSLWLDPTTGTSTTATYLTLWNDQSGNAYDFASGASKPIIPENGMNYNKVIRFSGNYLTTSNSTSFSNWTFYMILNVSGGDIDDDNYAIKYEQWPSTGKYGYTRFGVGDYSSTISSNFNIPEILRYDHNSSSNYVNIYSQHGGILQSGNINCGSTNCKGPIKTFGFNGDFGDFIVFSTQLTDATSNTKIESFLSLKYGITIDRLRASSTYLGSDGTVIYTDGGTYWNNIIGLGRDDLSSLLQKQSHTTDDTVRIYLSNLAASNTTNTAITSYFGADKAFVIIGSNSDRMKSDLKTFNEIPAGIFSRLGREWKVTNTGFTGTFSIDFTLESCGSITDADLRLLVDDDGDFSNAVAYSSGTKSILISHSGNTITISGITTALIPANSSKYITIGSVSANTPLPIDLISFEGSCTNNMITIKWSTASEINNDYFTVERSTDAINYAPIVVVKGVGNSNTTKYYKITDKNPMSMANYYRLKQTDYDGRYKYFPERSIDCKKINASEITLTFLPNPFLDIINLKIYKLTENNLQIKIIDLLGTEVKTIRENNLNKENYEVNIDLSALKSGVYFYVFTSGDFIRSGKLIKN